MRSMEDNEKVVDRLCQRVDALECSGTNRELTIYTITDIVKEVTLILLFLAIGGGYLYYMIWAPKDAPVKPAR